jgi:DNA-binding response OmpR family regulator
MAKILAIDDDANVVQVVKQILEKDGRHSVQIACDGVTGLASARREPPDLILLDLLMPGLDGMDVLRELKEKASTSQIPVLVLTAVGDETVMKKIVYEYGCDYVVKPVDAHTLRVTVDHAIRSGPDA